ncbi:hypothetical protein bpr_II170 (plasmid) [Butyrivibrio proteoclasticus B316]|uniref:Uncharacterized protein n=1 Tax=Butyrivibrio proteoclasticus (strain ATCC 51982 / DSM 14932 / B316) TaxID=515622 RepID=E0S3X6_BUTPB|nr:hypothetical protein bpr_II170 [Butyrivibrio proteoclasticus B316]
MNKEIKNTRKCRLLILLGCIGMAIPLTIILMYALHITVPTVIAVTGPIIGVMIAVLAYHLIRIQ